MLLWSFEECFPIQSSHFAPALCSQPILHPVVPVYLNKMRETTSNMRPPNTTKARRAKKMGEMGDFWTLSFFLIADSGFPIFAVFSLANLRFLLRCSGVWAIVKDASFEIGDLMLASDLLQMETFNTMSWCASKVQCGLSKV